MKTYSISELAKSFNLSRSTLLYYDRIDLLHAPERTRAGYRRYSQHEFETLERICTLRSIGLPLSDVKRLLSSDTAPSITILENRLKEMERQVVSIRGQQQTIVAMLKEMTSGAYGAIVDKRMWVNMLKAAGMDESSMMRWHAEFESRAPAAHHEFLLSLGIPENEAREIRERSREVGLSPSPVTDT